MEFSKKLTMRIAEDRGRRSRHLPHTALSGALRDQELQLRLEEIKYNMRHRKPPEPAYVVPHELEELKKANSATIGHVNVKRRIEHLEKLAAHLKGCSPPDQHEFLVRHYLQQLGDAADDLEEDTQRMIIEELMQLVDAEGNTDEAASF